MSEELVKLQPFLDKAHLLSPQEVHKISNKFLPFDKKLRLLKEFLSLEDAPDPFEEFSFGSVEQAGTDFMRFLRNPDNFPYTCKLFFNIDLQPFQHVILKELWTRPFPMLIGSRGLGKAEPVTNPILTNKGWIKMGDVSIGTKIYGRDGFLHNVKDIYPQGKKQVCRLKFADGRTIDCCEDHLWVVKKGVGKEKVLKTKDIIKDGCVWMGPSRKHAYKYKIPHCEPIQLDKKDLPIPPYILGCLLGDGCMTTLTPKIASDDSFIIDQFKELLPNFEIKRDISNNNYTIVDKDTKCEDCTCGKKHRNSLITKICKLNLQVDCSNKFIPEIYKQSSIEDRMELIRGLMDTDGCANKSGSIEFTNTCEKLVDDIIEVLRSLGISCIKSNDNREGESYINPQGKDAIRNFCYRVYINTSKPIFKLPRKLERLKNKITGTEKYNAIISAEYINEWVEMQCISVDSPDNTYITKDYIVTHNTWILALYAMLRLFFNQGCKVAVVGAGFRQAKAIFEYMETFWYRGPVFRDIIGGETTLGKDPGPHRSPDKWEMIVGNSCGMALPIGNGDKIRGQRANYLLCDEFASLSEEIFDTVIFGFASVSSSPQEKVKEMAKVNLLKSMNLWTRENEKLFNKANRGNQVVLSGTADYTFGHFYKTYNLYKGVIMSGNDPKKLKEAFGEKSVTAMKAEDCCIMRIPANLLPPGFMDEKIISAAKAKLDTSTYLKEYDATFPDDSSGFFKMSLIRSCECPIQLQNGDNIMFDPILRGTSNMKYVMAVDPASEKDKLALVILELHPSHRRIVYLWSIRRDEFKERLAKGVIKGEHDYFQYCAVKIRELARDFNIVEIAIDQGGGGIAIEEALSRQPENTSELPFYRIKDPIDTKEPKQTDYLQGRHILNMITFSKAEWVSTANHSLKLDMEQKTLIFPYHDMVSEEIAIQEDYQMGKVIIDKTNHNKEIRLYDSLTTVFEEIEELKKELVSIAHTKTPSSRERWDLPKHKGPDGKFITETKDRYSALLMANACGRIITTLDSLPPPREKKVFGGRVGDFRGIVQSGQDFYMNAPHWMGTTSHLYGKVVKKKRSNY